MKTMGPIFIHGYNVIYFLDLVCILSALEILLLTYLLTYLLTVFVLVDMNV